VTGMWWHSKRISRLPNYKLYSCLHPVAYVTIKSVYSTVNATFISIFVFIYTTCFDHIGSSSGVLTLVLKMHYKTLTPSLLVSTCYSASIPFLRIVVLVLTCWKEG
jgi:hypothetical protein